MINVVGEKQKESFKQRVQEQPQKFFLLQEKEADSDGNSKVKGEYIAKLSLTSAKYIKYRFFDKDFKEEILDIVSGKLPKPEKINLTEEQRKQRRKWAKTTQRPERTKSKPKQNKKRGWDQKRRAEDKIEGNVSKLRRMNNGNGNE